MNLNYLFYCKYFDSLTDDNAAKADDINKAIVNVTVKEVEKEYCFSQTFCMKTTYPGLLIGIGNPHDAAAYFQNTDAIKMGFTLDYVTGLPVIPGSTVKGILRSAFSQYPEYVIEKLAEVTGNAEWSKMSAEELKKIENNIFGNNEEANIAEQDIFLEAIPVKATDKNRILGEDFVTSHKGSRKELDGLVEPNPVRMLKVLPDVVFEFRFICQTTKVEHYVLDWKIKKALFAGILEDLGVGAKTNTGYGNMILQKNLDESHQQLEIAQVEVRIQKDKKPFKDSRHVQGNKGNHNKNGYKPGKQRHNPSYRKEIYK